MDTKFQSQLKAHGYKLTRPRLLAFEYLQKHDPASVNSLINSLSNQVDRASLYRTLQLFRQLEVIHDTVVNRQKMIELTDAFDIHHHHIACLKCGYTKSIEDKAIELRLKQLAESEGFAEPNHQVTISGICQNCSRQSILT